MHAKKRHFSRFTLPFYMEGIYITIALNRDGLEASGENVHNESLVLRIILGESQLSCR